MTLAEELRLVAARDCLDYGAMSLSAGGETPMDALTPLYDCRHSFGYVVAVLKIKGPMTQEQRSASYLPLDLLRIYMNRFQSITKELNHEQTI